MLMPQDPRPNSSSRTTASAALPASSFFAQKFDHSPHFAHHIGSPGRITVKLPDRIRDPNRVTLRVE